MKLVAAFLRIILGSGTIRLPEDLHARFIRDWIDKPNRAYLHPECTWTLDEGYPQPGTYIGAGFYDGYRRQRAITYQDWDQVVTQVIGSRIGAIVVGTYEFESREDRLRYSLPFTHFYRVRQGKIVSARYFTGTMSICTHRSRSLTDLFSAPHLPSLN